MKNLALLLAAIILGIGSISAETYVTMAVKAKVFDQANAQGYVTQNSKGADVEVLPGMTFKVADTESGWDVIVYSPGLRGFVMKSVEAQPDNLRAPAPGTYKVANQPGATISITNNDGKWSASNGKSIYAGAQFGNVVVFINAQGNEEYSLVNLNGTPIVMNYNNAITKFF